jgi:THO complex subunit 1
MSSALFQFCDYGIEGVVPPELLPADVRAKFNSKPGEKAKRPKREDTKGTSSHPKEPQVLGASCGPYVG